MLGGEFEREVEQPRDVVLGTSALLGIFLAVALVCAVCFGFGYSRGHSIPAPSAKAKPEPQPLGGTGPLVNESAAKPTPGITEPMPDAAGSGELPGMPPEPALDGKAAAPPNAVFGTERHVWSAPRAKGSTAAPAGAGDRIFATPALSGSSEPAQATAPNLMVQIAAVSHAADANTLAEALRHDSFHAIVRTSAADSLFHVQVGPFANLEAAKEMKAKLVDSGYNAFIKP